MLGSNYKMKAYMLLSFGILLQFLQPAYSSQDEPIAETINWVLKNYKFKTNESLVRFESISIERVDLWSELEKLKFHMAGMKLYTKNGDFKKAEYHLEQVKKIIYLEGKADDLSKQKIGELLTSSILYDISLSYGLMGRYPEAIQFANKHLLQVLQDGEKKQLARVYDNLGFLYSSVGASKLSKEKRLMAMEIHKSLGNYKVVNRLRLNILGGRINDEEFDDEYLKQEIRYLETIYRNSKYEIVLGYVLNHKGEYFSRIGEHEKAKDIWKEANNIAVHQSDHRLKQMVLHSLGRNELREKNFLEAKAYCLELLGLQQQSNGVIAPFTYNCLSQSNEGLGNISDSFHYLKLFYQSSLPRQSSKLVEALSGMDKSMLSLMEEMKRHELENKVFKSEIESGELRFKNEQFQKNGLIGLVLLIGITFFYFYRAKITSMKLESSMRDSLTGAYLRNYLSETMPAIIARFGRRKSPESHSTGLILIDCDNFKPVNDNFGHSTGDELLKTVTQLVSKKIRESDLLIRWGGDEFLVVCEDISINAIKELAERIRKAVNDHKFSFESDSLKVTLSIGYALHDTESQFDFDGLFDAADTSLYDSKQKGKNAVNGKYYIQDNKEQNNDSENSPTLVP